MIANKVSNEFRGFCLAGIRRRLVNAAGSLIEGLTGFVDGFGLVLHFHAETAFEHISDNRAGVGVGLRGFAWTYVTSTIVTLRLSPFNLGIKCENTIRSRWPLLDAGWVDVC